MTMFHSLAFWIAGLLLLGCHTIAYLIPLPNAGRAEGVAYLRGTNFIASDLFTGGVFLVDVESRLVTTVVRGSPGRVGIGCYATDDYIFVAGAGPFGTAGSLPLPPKPTLYVYTVSSGEDAAVCEIPTGGFINDVVADSEYAYYTDSIRPTLYRLHLPSMPRCNVTNIPMPQEQFQGDGFRGNGVVLFNNGLIVANGGVQTIFFVDFENKNKVTPILPEGSLPNCDGLAVRETALGPILIVAQNRLNKLSVWRLIKNGRSVMVRKIGQIVRPKQFGTPTTVAISDEYVVAANFNFSVPFVLPPLQNFTLFVLPLKL